MLILGRKEGQRILIGDDIMITVRGICQKWGHVKLGFDAPSHIKILREEIIDSTHPKYLTMEDLICLHQHNTKL